MFRPLNRVLGCFVISLAIESGSDALAAGPEKENNSVPQTLEHHKIDDGLQALKQAAIDLATDLFTLREDIISPANNQIAVFLSVDVGEFFSLRTVQLRIDDQEVENHSYSDVEVQSLLRGGTQRLYFGNLPDGEHELMAIFIGSSPHGYEYRRALRLPFTKITGPKYVELSITDRKIRAQPEFEVRE